MRRKAGAAALEVRTVPPIEGQPVTLPKPKGPHPKPKRPIQEDLNKVTLPKGPFRAVWDLGPPTIVEEVPR
jgi:hypothetical protein